MRTRTTAALSLLALLVACGSTPPAPTQTPTTSATPAVTTPAAPIGPGPATTEPKEAATPASKIDIPAPIRAAVDAADRAEDDKKLDAGRHPAEMLAFFGIAPGMKVGEIAAGFGYTTELLARVVGPAGTVYAENPKFILEKFAEKGWAARVAKPVNKNVKRVDRELDDPFPAEAKDLDAVVDVLFYHDTFWLKADRDKMNKAVFAALKKGGVYGVVDHSGRPGTGSSEVETLHRVEQKVVREEVEKAGFKLVAEADFMRNPSDARDWNASPRAAADRRGTSDRFVMKFVKP
jgi:predicted methyltransferase